MRAAVMTAPDTPLTIEDRPVPEPGPGELLIRVVACGMCHSEVVQWHGHHVFGRFPVVPGHEISGVVEALGRDVDFPAVGTRVGVPFLYDSCGHCDMCVRGDQILCRDKRATGLSVDGGYAEYVIVKAGYATPIPDGLDPVAAAPLMCAGITGFNGLRQGGVRPGSKVAVLGTGGVGTMAIRFAAAMGARVAVVSRGRHSEDEAKRLGAELFVATDEQDPAEALRAWDGGADLVLNTTPANAAAEAALGGIAPDGTLLMLGYGQAPLSIPPVVLVVNRIRVMGMPSGSPHDLRDTLAFAAAHGIVPESTPIPLEEAPATLAAMADGTARGRHVITFP
ncbi:alcohol dehydrogenase catalytic domain-containing protein [Actinomadura sp. NPDC047616]|uniref:alcohol dehydrogenase catalytic domain-containing protein n=1 Tax=Actinomadura sp. NPDC047616 TaxID=3155914 RepID=UPI0033C85769